MKTKSKSICFGILLIAASVAAHAAQFGDFTYESIGTEITITGYTGSGGAVTIPDTIGGLPVTSIGDGAFWGCASLTNLTIPNSVTSIGGGAFHYCASLTGIMVDPLNVAYSTVNGALCNRSQTTLIQCPGGKAGSYAVPDTFTSIGDRAFYACTSLTDITIPDSVTTIGEAAFICCTALTYVTIPDSITSIGSSAFGYWTSLPSATIPRNVTRIDKHTFYGCSSLTNVTMADTLTSIGESAFDGCSSLTSVTLPSGVTRVEADTFRGCVSLTSVMIPGGVTSIGECAFFGCTSLTSVTLPDSVISVGQQAFARCARLIDLRIPQGITSITYGAFSRCISLTTLTIPDSVIRIDTHAFSLCINLTGVYFEGNAPGLGEEIFARSVAVIVYYRTGTTGWGSTIAGRPTALWTEPPVYSEWLPSSGLPTQHPNASGEADDPDQDGMSNHAEMLAGTDPTDRVSLLTLECVPRMNDLTAEDQTPIGAAQHAVYFRSVPGKQYGVQWAESVDGPWNTTAVVSPTTMQKRLVFDKPATQAFYRVILAQ